MFRVEWNEVDYNRVTREKHTTKRKGILVNFFEDRDRDRVAAVIAFDATEEDRLEATVSFVDADSIFIYPIYDRLVDFVRSAGS